MYRCIDSAIQTPAEFGTGDISRIYPQETIFDNTQRNRMDQQVNRVNGIHAKKLYHTAPSVVFVLYIF